MNLTTLANVRQWVGSQTDDDNPLLTRLINMASGQILQHLQRPDLGLTTITEYISGRDTAKVQLRNWPVIAVSALSINGVTIPVSTSPTSFGFALEPVYGGIAGRPQNLGIVGGSTPVPIALPGGWGQQPYYGNAMGWKPFSKGVNNIAVTYQYGYAIQNEAQTIPATSPYQITPNAPYGAYGADNGVTYASSGIALTPISSGTPSAGQYLPPNLAGDSPTLAYTFAAADEGKAVLLNYSYVPYQVEQACIETVGERYRYKSRIGLKSQTMGGQETSAYDLSGLTKPIMDMLNPFRLAWGG